MRKRMQEIAAGKYEFEGPKVQFSCERMELTVQEQGNFKNSFQIVSKNNVPMRGIVFSNHPRMEIKNPQFEGVSAEINYEFHTEGLLEGDIQKGEFYVIMNKNEYSLSFVVSVARNCVTSSMGEIKSLKDFVKLARASFDEAYELFCQEDFFELLRNETTKVILLARALAYPMAPVSNLEEFLVATGMKERIEISCQCPQLIFEDVKEDIRQVIDVEKSGWGFADVHIYSDTGFIRFQKEHFTNGDFIGSSLRVPFYISSHNLHAGWNYGSIIVDSGLKKQEFQVRVKNGLGFGKKENHHRDLKETKYQLTHEYILFRTGKKSMGVWACDALRLLDHYLGMCPEDVFAWYAKAQVLLLTSRRQEAQWILDKYKPGKNEKYTLSNAYYLYLTTFLNKEKFYVRKTAEKVQEIYRRMEKKGLPFWILLFIGEPYENSTLRKYNAIKNWCESGNASPVFYVEAYRLIREQPGILEEIGSFESRLLNWAYKEEILTQNVLEQVALLMLDCRQYVPFIDRVLEQGYKQWPSENVLKAICSNGIKGEKYSEDYEEWYYKAIEQELNLTNLYEAYIISANNKGHRNYPKMVQYYFQYKTTLPYKHKAVIYAGIIRDKGQQTTLYLKCKPRMDQFALEQITAGHLDENLAVIYEDYLKQITMTHELARSLAPLLYIHKLTISNPTMKRVIVLHKQTKKEMSYPILNGTSYLPIYSKDHVVVFEDGTGNRFVTESDYDLQLLLPSASLTKKCLKLAPEQMPYLIRYFDEKPANSTFTGMDLSYLNILLSSTAISEAYKYEMRPLLISYYYSSESIELLDEYLKQLDFVGLDHNLRLQATELLIQRGFYQKAFEMMVAYGCTQIGSASMLTLCSKMIEYNEGEADDYLLGICGNVFFRGKYDEHLLNYLAKYYYGTTMQMYEIWNAAKDFLVDTTELEERLLAQMLYTESYLQNSQAVIVSYVQNGGKKLLLDAYMSFFSYSYVAKQTPLQELVFQQLLGMHQRKLRLLLSEKIALLKYISENYQEIYLCTAKELYEELYLQGLIFAFYDTLPDGVTAALPRMGKKVVEYRSNPNASVTIHYLRTGYGQHQESDYESQSMDEMFEGIFAREFTLFYGDSLQYYITEETTEGSIAKSSGQIYETQVNTAPSGSRYDYLNSIAQAEHLGEHERFQAGLEHYDRLLEKSRAAFQIFEG